MDWGNAIVRTKQIDSNGIITSVTMDLHLEGDFKKTEKKITWLAAPPSSQHIPVSLHDYDYLITKKKLEEEDDVNQYITPVTEFSVEAITDENIKTLKKGDIIQFERKGYYIFDGIYPVPPGGERYKFIHIPDGRQASLVSKAAAPVAPSSVTTSSKLTTKDSDGPEIDIQSRMYHVPSVYGTGTIVQPIETKMYTVKNIYASS